MLINVVGSIIQRISNFEAAQRYPGKYNAMSAKRKKDAKMSSNSIRNLPWSRPSTGDYIIASLV